MAKKNYKTKPPVSKFPVRGDSTREYGSEAKDIAANDKTFQAACAAASVKPTKRQASKWRRKMGAAYNAVQSIPRNS